jgi:uncharacterized membrane protein
LLLLLLLLLLLPPLLLPLMLMLCVYFYGKEGWHDPSSRRRGVQPLPAASAGVRNA